MSKPLAVLVTVPTPYGDARLIVEPRSVATILANNTGCTITASALTAEDVAGIGGPDAVAVAIAKDAPSIAHLVNSAVK